MRVCACVCVRVCECVRTVVDAQHEVSAVRAQRLVRVTAHRALRRLHHPVSALTHVPEGELPVRAGC